MKKLATTPATAKTTGRPPQGERAMSGAERQAALRRRQREAAMTAYGNPVGQPTPAILAALGRLLAQLDDPERAKDHATVRDMASGAVRELCRRYGINVSSR
jgi:hypothetical protein